MSTVSSSNSGTKRKYRFKAADESFNEIQSDPIRLESNFIQTRDHINNDNYSCEEFANNAAIIIDDSESESDHNFETWDCLEEDSKHCHEVLNQRSESTINGLNQLSLNSNNNNNFVLDDSKLIPVSEFDSQVQILDVVESVVIKRQKRGTSKEYRYNLASMANALVMLLLGSRESDRLALRPTARQFGVPYTSMRRIYRSLITRYGSELHGMTEEELRSSALKQIEFNHFHSHDTGNFVSHLSSENEEKFVDWLIARSRVGLGVPKYFAIEKARQLAELEIQNLLLNGEEVDSKYKEKKLAISERWLRRVVARSEKLAIRKTQIYETKRAKAVKIFSIENFYDRLAEVYEEYNIKNPEQVITFDETGFMGDYNGSNYVICEKNNRVSNKTTPVASFEGNHISLLHSCNANGVPLPPIIAHTGAKLNSKYFHNNTNPFPNAYTVNNLNLLIMFILLTIQIS